MTPPDEDQPGRWKQILEIYEAASELPPKMRRIYVESCSPSPSFAAEVLELLRKDEEQSHTSLPARPTPRTQPKLGTSTQVGKYVIIGFLGCGGMGEVYLAKDPELERTVAIKLMSREPSARPAIDLLIREAKAASALNHPNIVTVYEILDTGTELAMVMEAVEGTPLRALMGLPMVLDKVLRLGQQMAEALSAAHGHGVVHRDVKPENVVVRGDGYVKLLDFGMAKRSSVDEAASGSPTLEGTLRYMSPEQAAAGDVGPASDVFSLGIVLYELVAGKHPFFGETPYQTVHKILTETPVPISTARASVPEDLSRLLTEMLQKDPAKRPKSSEVKERLVRLQAAAAGKGTQRSKTVAFVAVATLGALLWIGLRNDRQSDVSRFQMWNPIPLTTDAGFEFEPRLSPDSRYVAYTRSTPDMGGFGVVVQPVDQPASTARVVLERAFSPAWSPDGEKLVVLRNRQGTPDVYEIVLVDRSGGEVRRIAEVLTPGPLQDWVPSPYLDFSPDGRYLVACDGWGPGPSALVLISVETGRLHRLTTPTSQVKGDFSPRFSPDGRKIAFTRVLRMASSELYVLNLSEDLRADGEPFRIPSEDLWNAFPAWTPDGTNLVFVSGLMHGATLKSVRASADGIPYPLPVAETSASPLDVRAGPEPGKSRIVYCRLTRDDNIVRLELPTSPGAPIRRTTIVDSSFVNELPAYSPDGKRIAFASNRTGSFQVWVANADGSSQRQVTNFKTTEVLRMAWHPSGKFMAVQASQPGAYGLYELDLENGNFRLLVEGPAEGPAYTLDGQYLLYGLRKTGAPQIWRMPARGGESEPLPNAPGDSVRQVNGGRTLVMMNGLDIFRQDNPGGPITRILSNVFSQQAFDVTDQAVYALVKPDPTGPWTLSAYQLPDARSDILGTLQKNPGNGIAVSPDGRFVLSTEREHFVVDLMTLDSVPTETLQQDSPKQ